MNDPHRMPMRKLPIEIVVKRAFLYSWESRHFLGPPYLIYAALTILAELIFRNVASEKDHTAVFILGGIEQVFAMAFAVGLHRYVLLGEAQPNLRFFRFDKHFVRYLLITILLFTLGVLAAMPMASVAEGVGPGGEAGMGGATAFFGIVTMMLAATILIRLVLMLPSAAIGDDARAKSVWEATQGNSLRLLAAAMMTLLPFLIVEALLLRLIPEKSGAAAEAAITIAVGLVSAAQLVVLTMMFSLCYDVLIRGNGPTIDHGRSG